MDRAARLQRIYETIRDIPAGCVASYGQVAEIAGIPRGARQVGWALRQLPRGHDVPWHRVITASGCIAFGEGTPEFRRQLRGAGAGGAAVPGVAGRHANLPLAAGPGRVALEAVLGVGRLTPVWIVSRTIAEPGHSADDRGGA